VEGGRRRGERKRKRRKERKKEREKERKRERENEKKNPIKKIQMRFISENVGKTNSGGLFDANIETKCSNNVQFMKQAPTITQNIKRIKK
jgi:hypothetical protein